MKQIVLSEADAVRAIALCDQIEAQAKKCKADLEAALIGLKQACDQAAALCTKEAA